MEKNSSETSEHRSLTHSTVRGVFWITAGRVLNAPLNVIAVAVLARLLTPSDFGIVAIGMIVATLAKMIVDGSFGMVLVQRRELDPAVIGASLLLAAGLALLFAVAVIVGAPLIEREFDFPHLSEVLILLGAVLPITAITTITTALLQRAFQFGALTLNAFISQLAYTLTSISLALGGMGLWSLVWAQIAYFAVEALLGFWAVRNRYSVRVSTSALLEVLNSGGMFTASKLLNWAATNIDRLVIGRFLGAAELGFYTRAASFMRTMRQMAGAGPLRVLFASFAKIQHDRERMRRAYIRALSVSLILAALVSAFVVVNAELIVRILLGPRWLTTVPLMQILFAAFLARSGYVVAEAVPLALGLGGQTAIRQGIQLILVTVGAAFGAQFGVIGAAIGVFTAYWIFYFICLVFVQKLLRPNWMEVLRVHANSILVTLPPILFALASRWLLPGDDLLLQLVPAILFGIAATAVLAAAPASLVSHDVVRARTHVWERLLARLQRGGVRR